MAIQSVDGLLELAQNSTLRLARVLISYKGGDITSQVTPDLLDFEYSESLSYEADDMCITVQDRDGKWRGEWQLGQGQEINATIRSFNALNLGEGWQLVCGVHEIDEVEFEFPPAVVKIKCCSVPVTSGIKFTMKSTPWEKTTLQAMAAQVASQNSLTLNWQLNKNDPIGRCDQDHETDLAFLARITKRYGHCMKVQDKSIIIFDEEDYEAKPAVGDIVYGQSGMLRGNFRITSQDIAAEATVSYQDPKDGEVVDGKFQVPDDNTNSEDKKPGFIKVDNQYVPLLPASQNIEVGSGSGTAFGERPLFMNSSGGSNALEPLDESPDDTGAADLIAKKHARNKNKHRHKSELEMMGNLKIVAANNYNFVGFRNFDGKWICEKVIHRVGKEGFVTRAEFRRCLVGY